MSPRCGACQAAPAAVWCECDAAFFCASCEQAAHAGPLTKTHARVPICRVCSEAAATLYCHNDKAFLCAACNDACHAGLPLPHNIVPAAQAVREGLAAAAPLPAAAPEHSACGESSPGAAAPAPRAAGGVKRRASEDSAQRVPECAVVPPGIDLELAGGQPMDKHALAKTLWGKELDALEMDPTWLDRLDMGLDFGDDLLADLAAAAPLDGPAAAAPGGALPPASPAAAAALERQTTDEFFASLADDFSVPSLPAAAALPPQMVPQPMAAAMPPMGGFAAAPAPVMYVPTVPMVPLMAPALVPVAQQAPVADAAAPAPKRARRAPARVADSEAFLSDDDSSDAEWCHEEEMGGGAASAPAPRSRSAAASAAGAAAAVPAAAAPAGAPLVVDGLTREQRVARYREKRKNRQFRKVVRYASRKAYAEVRPRIKGRFAKREELEAWRTAERAMAAGAAAAGLALGDGIAAMAPVDAPGVVPVM